LRVAFFAEVVFAIVLSFKRTNAPGRYRYPGAMRQPTGLENLRRL
jgi:hypothetical protein